MGGWVDGWMGGWVDGWMGGWVDGWMGGWVDGWMGGWMDGWMGGWVDGWMGGWVDGWMGGWVGGWMNININKNYVMLNIEFLMLICKEERDLQDENRALAITDSFQVDKEIAVSSGQPSQVRNSFNTTLNMIYYQ